MRATQYYTATTLDGYIADEHNSLEWLFEVDHGDDGGENPFATFFADVGAIAMGATTYEWILATRERSTTRRSGEPYGDRTGWVFTPRSCPGSRREHPVRRG